MMLMQDKALNIGNVLNATMADSVICGRQAAKARDDKEEKKWKREKKKKKRW